MRHDSIVTNSMESAGPISGRAGPNSPATKTQYQAPVLLQVASAGIAAPAPCSVLAVSMIG